MVEEARVSRAGLRVWRAELRREKGGVRHKRRVLVEWGRYARQGRREWPAQLRRRFVLLQVPIFKSTMIYVYVCPCMWPAQAVDHAAAGKYFTKVGALTN